MLVILLLHTCTPPALHARDCRGVDGTAGFYSPPVVSPCSSRYAFPALRMLLPFSQLACLPPSASAGLAPSAHASSTARQMSIPSRLVNLHSSHSSPQ